MVEVMGNDCFKMIQALQSEGAKIIERFQDQMSLDQSRLAQMEERTAQAEQRSELDRHFFTKVRDRVIKSEKMLSCHLELLHKIEHRVFTGSASGAGGRQNQLTAGGRSRPLLGPGEYRRVVKVLGTHAKFSLASEECQSHPSTLMQPEPIVAAHGNEDIEMHSTKEGSQSAINGSTPDAIPVVPVLTGQLMSVAVEAPPSNNDCQVHSAKFHVIQF